MTTIIQSRKLPYHPFFRTFHMEKGTINRKNFAPLNIIENDHVYKIEMNVAGWNKEDIEIKIEEDTLTIAGEKKNSEMENGEQFHVREFTNSRFYRSIILGDTVDQEDISAELKDGILTIELKKADTEESLIKKIEIQ